MKTQLFKNLFGRKQKREREEKLLKMYEDGAIIQVDGETNNKEYIKQKLENGNN